MAVKCVSFFQRRQHFSIPSSLISFQAVVKSMPTRDNLVLAHTMDMVGYQRNPDSPGVLLETR
jgi:hypothetical protein